MAIYSLENNYKVPGESIEPLVFTLSSDKLLPVGEDFNFALFNDHDLYAQCELVLKISRPGSKIKADEAHKYFDSVTTGISFTSLDIQSVLNGLEISWSEAKDWKYSRFAEVFMSITSLEALKDLHFCIYKNRMPQQMGYAKNMALNFFEVIERVSKDYELEPGDLVFTGAPSAFFPVQPGDTLEVFLDDDSTGEVKIDG